MTEANSRYLGSRDIIYNACRFRGATKHLILAHAWLTSAAGFRVQGALHHATSEAPRGPIEHLVGPWPDAHRPQIDDH